MTISLDNDFVVRYARPPAQTTLDRAISLHRNVRDVLGETDYLTLLQGSYKNDTALADMNDVDIVAIVRNPPVTSFWSEVDWARIFSTIESKLAGDSRYQGKWKRHDKCITLDTGVNIDIVPAVPGRDADVDPIEIYSWGRGRSRKNWPRIHYENAAKKSAATSGTFKQAVRLFKNWARCHFGDQKVAPSYYFECLIYSLPDKLFTGELADVFVALSEDILVRYGGGFSATYTLSRVGGEGDLFTSAEWDIDRFRRLRSQLTDSLVHAKVAVRELDLTRSRAAWRMAFAGQAS